jgi:PII-like signaling protein
MRRDRPTPGERLERDAVQLTLYIAEPHVAGRRSRVDELMRAAVLAGMEGGTVVVAYQGFGRRHEHEPTILHRPDETPLTVIFIDAAERIASFMTVVDRILPDAIAVSEPVRAIRYRRPRPPG